MSASVVDVCPLGQSGLLISRLGLGGVPLGPLGEEEPDVSRAVGVVEAALDAGVNWLDTSENYLATENESLIGSALSRLDGESFGDGPRRRSPRGRSRPSSPPCR